MSVTSDLNLMDMLLNQPDSFSNFEDANNDKHQETAWLSDEFLESFLKSEQEVGLDLFSNDLGCPIEPVPAASNLVQEAWNQCMSSPETHVSAQSPESSNLQGCFTVQDGGILVPEYAYPDSLKSEIVDAEDGASQDSDLIANQLRDLPTGEELLFLSSGSCSDESSCYTQASFSPMLHSSRRIFKAEGPYSRMRGIKVLGIKHPFSRFIRANRKRTIDTAALRDEGLSTDDGAASDDSSDHYKKLELTPEEKKLMAKEGITLPTHYPLTKQEERELKRIRRKIRNKLSAQDSRRRKKEYVDGLEERVKRCSEENIRLIKCIKQLQTQNVVLVNQVKRLQASLAKNGTSSQTTAQPSTCLLVLFLSLALVLAPNLRNSALKTASDDEGIVLNEQETKGQSRNLLFSELSALESICPANEETKVLLEELKKIDLSKLDISSGIQELLQFKQSMDSTILKEHDYFRPRKRRLSTSSSSASSDWSGPVSPDFAKKGLTKFQEGYESVVEIDSDDSIKKKNRTMDFDNSNPVVIDLLD